MWVKCPNWGGQATRLLSEPDLGFHRAILCLVRKPEAEALANSLHGVILREYIGRYAFDSLSPRDFYQPPQQLRSQASMMKIVADQDRHFRIVGPMCLCEPSHTPKISLPPEGPPWRSATKAISRSESMKQIRASLS